MNHPEPITLRLHDIAHARTGDKGNHSNICLFAYRPQCYALLVEQVTEARVATLFASRRPTAVRRYLLPRLDGMNLVIDNALDGGVNESLNLDMHGKALSFLLLGIDVIVPGHFLRDGIVRAHPFSLHAPPSPSGRTNT